MSPSAWLRMPSVRRAIESHSPRSIIEVGCGMGAAAWYLAPSVDTYRAFEPDIHSFNIAKERLEGIPGVTLENSFLPSTPDDEFDGLMAFEVLEHISEDLVSLSSWVRWVRRGGFVILSVPAKQSRFGPMDEAVGHYRRYDEVDLRDVMEGAGLVDVELRLYGMPLGYLLEGVRQVVLSRRLPPEGDIARRTSRSGRSFQPNSSGRLIKALTYPFAVAQRPFENSGWGTGWVAVGERPL